MKIKMTLPAFTLALFLIVPSMASAQFYALDTGTPPSTTPVLVLSTSQFLADEFAINTTAENVTSLSAYLTEGAGQPGNTFTFDIYSSTAFLGRNRAAPVYTATGTFTANGWNTTTVNWTPTATGDYWLALQIANVQGHTPGLDAPLESSASSGTIPALAFAVAGTNNQYAISSNNPIGLEMAPEPSSWAMALLCIGSFVYLRRLLSAPKLKRTRVTPSRIELESMV